MSSVSSTHPAEFSSFRGRVMKKVPVFVLVLMLLGLVVACAPATTPTTSTPMSASVPRTTSTPAAVSKPIATPTPVPIRLQYDWVGMYPENGSVTGYWGDFDRVVDPSFKPWCPTMDGVEPILCEITNVRRNGVLVSQTKDGLPLCRSGQVQASTPFPSPPPGVQEVTGRFFGIYECRDVTGKIFVESETIEKKIWGAGQACPQQINLKGWGPFKLIFCFPLGLESPTPTPTRRPSI